MTNRKILFLSACLGMALAAITWSASVIVPETAQQVARASKARASIVVSVDQ